MGRNHENIEAVTIGSSDNRGLNILQQGLDLFEPSFAVKDDLNDDPVAQRLLVAGERQVAGLLMDRQAKPNGDDEQHPGQAPGQARRTPGREHSLCEPPECLVDEVFRCPALLFVKAFPDALEEVRRRLWPVSAGIPQEPPQLGQLSQLLLELWIVGDMVLKLSGLS